MDDRPTARVMIGRQGIYDADRTLVGHELLFRDLAVDADRHVSGIEMTAEVVYGSLSLGLVESSTSGRTFYNADRDVLLDGLLYSLPAGSSVIEVLETVELDDEVIEACESLAAAGYAIAADDFVWRPGAERLLDCCSIVKLDVLHTPPGELAGLIETCRAYDVEMLAEKVERLEELEELVAAGFSLFQGYALERPQVLEGAVIEPSDLVRLHGAVTMLDSDPGFEELEAVLRADPGLSVQVIRLASQGRPGGMRHRIGSLHEALVIAGTRQVRNWVALLLARPTNPARDDGYRDALIRARACELLATRIDGQLGQLGFAAGMLSAIDLLFPVPVQTLRASLALTDELDAAAFGTSGPVGLVVGDATDFQLAKADAVLRSGLTYGAVAWAFAEAHAWTSATLAAQSPNPQRRHA